MRDILFIRHLVITLLMVKLIDGGKFTLVVLLQKLLIIIEMLSVDVVLILQH